MGGGKKKMRGLMHCMVLGLYSLAHGVLAFGNGSLTYTIYGDL